MTELSRTELVPGFEVSAIGFGAMALSHVYGETDPEQAPRTLEHCLDAGVTFLDTADVYGKPRPGTEGPAGTNEELVAGLLSTRRNEVQLATKFGITGRIGSERDPDAKATRGDRDYVRAACEASLRRLGTDVIDLYYMHRRDLDIPIEETVGAMAELVAEGKVRHLGLSEVTGPELRAAYAVHPIAAVQSEWSLWSRDVERNVAPTCAELRVGFVPYSPLGRGFLTGKLTREQIASDVRAGQHRFDGDNYDVNMRAVAQIQAVADELDATAAQVALAWLLAQGRRYGLPVVPIPGTRSPQRIDENAAAASLQLRDDQLARLDAVADQVAGTRNLTFASDDWISAGRE